MWWLCSVSSWLGWRTFPRIPFTVCFQLGWATRRLLWGSWRAAVKQELFYHSYILAITCWLISLEWGFTQTYNFFFHLIFNYPSSASMTPRLKDSGSQLLQDANAFKVTGSKRRYGLWSVLMGSNSCLGAHPCSLLFYIHLPFSTFCPADFKFHQSLKKDSRNHLTISHNCITSNLYNKSLHIQVYILAVLIWLQYDW